MQRLEVSVAVQPIYGSLGVERLNNPAEMHFISMLPSQCKLRSLIEIVGIYLISGNFSV